MIRLACDAQPSLLIGCDAHVEHVYPLQQGQLRLHVQICSATVIATSEALCILSRGPDQPKHVS